MKYLLILKILTAHAAIVPLMQQFDTKEQCQYVITHLERDKYEEGDFWGKGHHLAPEIYSAECLELPMEKH